MRGGPLPFSVSVARVPPAGKHFRVEAGEAERKAVAAALGIVDVADLVAELDVRPLGADAFSVHGALRAAVVQTDVVTLEPVRQEVGEAIDLTLVPAESVTSVRGEGGVEAPEDRDVYRGDRIDLGAIVVEHLALGLDPYPRSPGVEFPGHVESSPSADTSPFAVLSKLKRGQE